MEIKRRLTKIAHSLSPQIESMNVSTEMTRMLDRFEELVRYAQEKIDRAAERQGNTIGKQVDDARKKADKEVADHQTAESEENLRDQQESFEERNKIVDKSRDMRTEDEKRADEEAEESRQERGATKESDAADLAAEVDASITASEVKERQKPTKKKAKKKKRRSSK